MTGLRWGLVREATKGPSMPLKLDAITTMLHCEHVLHRAISNEHLCSEYLYKPLLVLRVNYKHCIIFTLHKYCVFLSNLAGLRAVWVKLDLFDGKFSARVSIVTEKDPTKSSLTQQLSQAPVCGGTRSYTYKDTHTRLL